MKKAHVLTCFLLGAVGREIAQKNRRMRRVDDDELFHAFRMGDSERPGGGATPIVSDEHKSLVTKMRRECAQVGDEVLDAVVLYALRFGREIVAARVGRDRKVIAAEFLKLAAPRVPEFRKAVHEQNELAAAGARVMKSDAVYVRVVVPDHRRCALARRHRLLAAIVVEAALGLASEPTRFDVFYQERAGAVFRVGETFVEHLHDREAGIEADEVG